MVCYQSCGELRSSLDPCALAVASFATKRCFLRSTRPFHDLRTYASLKEYPLSTLRISAYFRERPPTVCLCVSSRICRETFCSVSLLLVSLTGSDKVRDHTFLDTSLLLL